MSPASGMPVWCNNVLTILRSKLVRILKPTWQALAAMAALLMASMAHAGFYGNAVSANYVWPNVNAALYASGSVNAGTAVEFPKVGTANIVVDFSDTGFRVTFPSGWTFGTITPRTFDGMVITDAGATMPDFTGATVANSNIPGFSGGALSFDADHVYVNLLALSAIPAGGFVEVAVQFKSAPPPATPPGNAVEYFNATMGHYFITAFPEEAAALDAGRIAGWARTGYTFPVDTSAVGAAQPVCRFFSATFAPKSSHFYTPYAAECAAVKAGAVWSYEAIAFYLSVPDGVGNCPAGATPIYRFYNNGTTNAPNHRYTSDPLVVRMMKAQGWTPEGNGNTGVFACGPAVPASKSSLAVKVEFNPALRFLNTGDGASIIARTATTITFGKVVALNAGDVFVVPEIGAWRAIAVQRSANQTVVTVEEPTLEELFTELDIAGTADIDDTPELGVGVVATTNRKGLETETETTFVRTTNAAGDKGRKFVAKLQAQCGSNPQNKMRLIEFTGEIYGLQNINFNMKMPGSSVFGPLTYKVTAGAYIGCKVSLPLGSPLKLIDVPIASTAGFLRIQLIAQARLETNIAPVLQIIELEAAGNIPTTTSAPALNMTNQSLASTLLQGASVGNTFNATLIGELDVSTKLVVPLVGTLLGGAGVKTGPALDVTAKAVAKPAGADVDICAELKWPSELYLQYRTGRTVTSKSLFQTDYPVKLPDSWKQCPGNAPTGDWRFTTRACKPDPTNGPACNTYCNDTVDFTLSANADKSKIDQFFPVGSSDLYLSLKPQGPVRNYLGSTQAGGVVQVETMQFATDYKSAAWVVSAIYPSGDAVCSVQQSGDAVLTLPR